MVRLGYACINTVLRAQDIYTNRTLRLAKVKEHGVECAKELGLKNIKDLIPIIKWNEANGIRFFRVSSCVFPFASESQYGYSLSYAAKELKEAGDLAKKYGHRLTTHPGQYNVLCSPHDNVVEKTFKDLSYHCEMLDLMGLGPDSVMIIHMGGAYGDKTKSLERFEKNFLRLPENVRNRIVLENDEISYKVEELLPICKKLKIPLVLDWHHDRLNPSSKPIESYLPEIDAIWKERGIKPKQHYSESAKGHPNPRTHSDYIARLPPCAPDMDLMIEAKMKDQTVLRICRHYGIVPDTKVYPTNEPTALSDDEEVEHQNVTMLGQARKKHVWKKPSKKREIKGEEEGEEGATKKTKKRAKKDDETSVKVTKTKKVTKTADGKTVETEVTKKKRKKGGSDDEADEDFNEIKTKRTVRKAKKTKKEEGEEEEEESEWEVKPKKGKKAKGTKEIKKEQEEEEEEAEKTKKGRKAKGTKEIKKEQEEEEEEAEKRNHDCDCAVDEVWVEVEEAKLLEVKKEVTKSKSAKGNAVTSSFPDLVTSKFFTEGPRRSPRRASSTVTTTTTAQE